MTINRQSIHQTDDSVPSVSKYWKSRSDCTGGVVSVWDEQSALPTAWL